MILFKKKTKLSFGYWVTEEIIHQKSNDTYWCSFSLYAGKDNVVFEDKKITKEQAEEWIKKEVKNNEKIRSSL